MILIYHIFTDSILHGTVPQNDLKKCESIFRNQKAKEKAQILPSRITNLPIIRISKNKKTKNNKINILLFLLLIKINKNKSVKSSDFKIILQNNNNNN